MFEYLDLFFFRYLGDIIFKNEKKRQLCRVGSLDTRETKTEEGKRH